MLPNFRAKRRNSIFKCGHYQLAARDLKTANPQISTDGFPASPEAVRTTFGDTANHGVLIKNYANPETGRYAPPDFVDTSRFDLGGIGDLKTICTSHVERCNLTIRTFMRRFTRLALGFSKKKENLSAAIAMHVAHYNFCRMHGSLPGTPAMAANGTGSLWSLEKLHDEIHRLVSHRRRGARLAAMRERMRDVLN